MFHVEFIGLPGAGKSHIKTNIVNALKLTDKKKYITAEEAFLLVSQVKIDRMYRLILKSLPNNLGLKVTQKLANRSIMQFEAQNRFLANWGKSFETYLSSSVFDKMTIKDREIGISDFMYAGAIFECINGSISGNRVVFFDEGFIQKSFMFIMPTIEPIIIESKLIRYLELIPISNLIIHVRADIHNCYERMVSRKRGVIRRLKGANKEDVLNFLKISDDHIKLVVHLIKNRKDILLLEIDNNDDHEKTIDELKNKIILMTDSYG